MGGTDGFFPKNTTPEQLRDLVREAEEKRDNEMFKTTLNKTLYDLLVNFNDRDKHLVEQRIKKLLEKIKDKINSSLNTIFGGSIAKHTFVDGLSDIDALLFIDKSDFRDMSPKAVIDYFKNLLISAELTNVQTVESGKLAITVKYKDGMEIQLLPALRMGEKYKLASSNGKKWSEIEPKNFTDALTKANDANQGKLVSIIKLAKAINGQLPGSQQLTGYHLEVMAIGAFRNYKDKKTLSDMLIHFFTKASEFVKHPSIDKTKQSLHVDDYLGKANSKERQQASHILSRIARRMKNASASTSRDQWLRLFGDDE